MAVLSDADRRAVWAELIRRWSEVRTGITIPKSDIRDAINALDNWLDSNASSINNALPAAAKAGLTTAQKAELLSFVVARRYIVEA